MGDSSLSSTANTPDDRSKVANNERPKSLDLENANLDNDEDDLGEAKSTGKKAKELSSSQEDVLSSRNAELESPDEGEDASQRSSSRSKSIANSLKSKIRDLSPSRRAGTSRSSEKKVSKPKTPPKLQKSPGNWLPASFNQIFSSYKTKCGDFRRLFKDLPDTEQLVVDYSCALQRDILVHGRLYISQNWLCFYANIFGWETFVTVQCSEISSIRKEKTALVIPNAIQICTETEKYFFASFISRDTAYTVLFRIWQNALLDQPLTPSELIQMVGKYSEPQNEASSENEDTDDEEKQTAKNLYELDSDSDSDEGQELRSESLSSLSQSQSSLGTDNISTENQISPAARKDSETSASPFVSVTPPSPGVPPDSSTQTCLLHEGGTKTEATAGQTRAWPERSSSRIDLMNFLRSPQLKKKSTLPTEDCPPPKEKEGSSDLEEEGTASEYQENEFTEVPVNCLCDTHLSREIVNEEFPVVVDTLYEYLFTESDFYKRVQKARRTKDLVFRPWEKTQSGQKRTITYTVSLNHPIGPKHSATTEQQHCLKGSVPGRLYVVQTEISNDGIPYGDSFSVVNKYCITRASSMTSRLRITSEVKYHKSVWGFVRNMIEKNAVEGLEGFFQFLAESLRSETTQGQWPSKNRKASPTRRHKRTRSLKTNEEMMPTSDAKAEVPKTQWQRLSAAAAMSSVLGIGFHFPQIKMENRVAVLVTVLLGALLVLNIVLVYRLLLLEHATQSRIYWDGNLDELPTEAEEWAKLLQQQRNMQAIEIKRWRDVLTSSIQLMSQVQQSLDALQKELGKEQRAATESTT